MKLNVAHVLIPNLNWNDAIAIFCASVFCPPQELRYFHNNTRYIYICICIYTTHLVSLLLLCSIWTYLFSPGQQYCNLKIRRAPLDEFHLDLLQLRRMRQVLKMFLGVGIFCKYICINSRNSSWYYALAGADRLADDVIENKSCTNAPAL